MKNNREKTVVIKPTVINQKKYEKYFVPFKIGEHDFDPIELKFKESLEMEEKEYLEKVTLKEFTIDMEKYSKDPEKYLDSIKEASTITSLSEKEIIRFFLKRRRNLPNVSLFIMGDRLKISSTFEDLRIASIKRIDKKRFFLYNHPFCHLDNLIRDASRQKINTSLIFLST